MSTPSKIRILVVDDHRLFAEGLVELLSSESDFKIVGQSRSIAEAERSLGVTTADIVLLDVHLADGIGFLLHDWINDRFGHGAPKVLYVTADDRLVSISRAMNLGAMAYLAKTGGWEEIAAAIRRALEGAKSLGMNIAAKLSEFSFESGSRRQLLSAREMEILKGMSEGLTAVEMSSQMGLALPTVRTYISRMFQKLGANDRAHAVSLGYARGLIES